MRKNDKTPGKRKSRYSAPTLTVYGQMAKLTASGSGPSDEDAAQPTATPRY